MAATLDARLRLNSAEFSGGLSRALRESNAFVGKMSSQFGTLKNILVGGAVGSLGIGGITAGLDKAVEFENYERMLSLVSGGVNGAKLELAELRKEALRPGLDLQSAVDATVRLKTMGYTSDEARKHIVSLSNKVAAFGGGGEEMKGVIRALSQISSKGKISAEEINQIAERMPGIRDDMEAAFGTSNTEELQKMGLSAQTFIDTILGRWAEAPEVVSGLGEEMKNLRAVLDSFKAYSGQVFAPMVGGMASLLRGFGTIHQAATLAFDGFYKGEFANGVSRQMDAEDFAGRMELKVADANQKKRQEEEAARDEAEKHRKALQATKEFMARRESVVGINRQAADTMQEELAIVEQQISEMSHLEHVIKQVNDAYADGSDISKETMEEFKKAMDLKGSQEKLKKGINEQKRKEIEAEVAKEMRTPEQRRKEMRNAFDQERAQKKVLMRREEKELKRQMAEAKKNELDNIKQGKFPGKDQMRQQLRRDQAADWKNVFKDSEQYLKSIEQILNKLATA